MAGAACYGAMLALLARWRARLPAKLSVYAYFTVLMLLNALAALGARRLPLSAWRRPSSCERPARARVLCRAGRVMQPLAFCVKGDLLY